MITNNESLYVDWKSGNEDDPYTPVSESWKIVNNHFYLTYIPDPFSKVVIPNYVEIHPRNDLKNANEFKVNYQNGRVEFRPSENGKTVSTNYYSRGVIRLSANRIISQTENPNVVENLQDIINSTKNSVAEFIHKGDFSSVVTYFPRNIVNYNGNSYINVKQSVNILPTQTSHWERFIIDTMQFKIEPRTSDPVNPEVGRIWLRTDL